MKVKRGRSWSKQRVDPRLDIEKFIEEAFKTDRRVRYVGIVDSQFHVLASRMRENTTSITSDSTDRNFVQIMPPIIVEGAEKLQPFLGKLHVLVARYDRRVVAFYRLRDMAVVWTFEPEIGTPFMAEITDTFRRLSKQYLST